MRWFRPRPQRLVLRTVQMRVTLADDAEAGDGPVETQTVAPERMTLVPEIATVSAAPPLAVRPLEDAEWTFHN